jgi:hypothetical protein
MGARQADGFGGFRAHRPERSHVLQAFAGTSGYAPTLNRLSKGLLFDSLPLEEELPVSRQL